MDSVYLNSLLTQNNDIQNNRMFKFLKNNRSKLDGISEASPGFVNDVTMEDSDPESLNDFIVNDDVLEFENSLNSNSSL